MLRGCFGELPTAKLEDIEGLALTMRGKGVVITCAFRFVEERLCAVSSECEIS